MKGLITAVYLSVTLLISVTRANLSFIQGYEIDNTGEYGRDCEIISASVTIINCPREQRYEVILTEMLANTTIAEIVNEVKGADDTIVDSDREQDWIRRTRVENVKVSHIKKSNELEEPLYRESLIVVAKNETDDALENQYSVTRYWQNTYTNWLESEYLFDLTQGPYDDFYVFDNYAITMKDQQLIYAAYFGNHRGRVVPLNFEQLLYDELQFTDDTFERITFWDQSGEGDWLMIGAIRTPGAVTLYRFDLAVNYESFKGAMTRNEENESYLLPETQITAFIPSKDLLTVACASCNDGDGRLYVYNPETVRRLKGIPGEKGKRNLGQHVSVREGTIGTNQIWYSSQNGDILQINSLVAFQDREKGTWEFEDKGEQYSFLGIDSDDTISYSCFGTSCVYKSTQGQELGTFKSCDFNYRLDTNYTLEERACKPCGDPEAFSYGFASEQCETCASLEEAMLQSPALDQLAFYEACPQLLEPEVNETEDGNSTSSGGSGSSGSTTGGGSSTDTTTGTATNSTDGSETEQIGDTTNSTETGASQSGQNSTEGESSEGGLTTPSQSTGEEAPTDGEVTDDSDVKEENLPTNILIICGIAVSVVVVAGFVGYKIWVHKRQKFRVKQQILEQQSGVQMKSSTKSRSKKKKKSKSRNDAEEVPQSSTPSQNDLELDSERRFQIPLSSDRAHLRDTGLSTDRTNRNRLKNLAGSSVETSGISVFSERPKQLPALRAHKARGSNNSQEMIGELPKISSLPMIQNQQTASNDGGDEQQSSVAFADRVMSEKL